MTVVGTQLGAACVLCDSGTIAEESMMLDLAAVTLRDAIERPEALDTGWRLVDRFGFVERHRGHGGCIGRPGRSSAAGVGHPARLHSAGCVTPSGELHAVDLAT